MSVSSWPDWRENFCCTDCCPATNSAVNAMTAECAAWKGEAASRPRRSRVRTDFPPRSLSLASSASLNTKKKDISRFSCLHNQHFLGPSSQNSTETNTHRITYYIVIGGRNFLNDWRQKFVSFEKKWKKKSLAFYHCCSYHCEQPASGWISRTGETVRPSSSSSSTASPTTTVHWAAFPHPHPWRHADGVAVLHCHRHRISQQPRPRTTGTTPPDWISRWNGKKYPWRKCLPWYGSALRNCSTGRDLVKLPDLRTLSPFPSWKTEAQTIVEKTSQSNQSINRLTCEQSLENLAYEICVVYFLVTEGHNCTRLACTNFPHPPAYTPPQRAAYSPAPPPLSDTAPGRSKFCRSSNEFLQP